MQINGPGEQESRHDVVKAHRRRTAMAVIGGPEHLFLEGLKGIAGKFCQIVTVSSDFTALAYAARWSRANIAIIDTADGCWDLAAATESLISISTDLKFIALVSNVQVAEGVLSHILDPKSFKVLAKSVTAEKFEEEVRRFAIQVVTRRGGPEEWVRKPGGGYPALTPRQ